MGSGDTGTHSVGSLSRWIQKLWRTKMLEVKVTGKPKDGVHCKHIVLPFTLLNPVHSADLCVYSGLWSTVCYALSAVYAN